MYRILLGLLGLAVIGAVFAGIYYLPDQELVERRPAFGVAVGEARPDFIEPGIQGTPITVNITVTGGPIDIYVMDDEWLASTIRPVEGGFNLTAPFSYHAQWSRFNVTGPIDLEFIATGDLRRALLFDNSDTYYDDTAPQEEAFVSIRTRYLEEETKSIVWGYIAATPSVLLVGFTFGRQWQRRREQRRSKKD